MIRKFPIIICVLVFGLNASSQDIVQLKQRWFSKTLQAFYIGDIIDTIIKLPKVYEKTCYLLNDTIFYHAAYSRSFGGGKQDTIIETDKYKIIHLSSDTLVMLTTMIRGEKVENVDTFFSEKSLIDPTFKLQRLQLTYSDNYLLSEEGKEFALDIDSVGNIIYEGKHNTKPYIGTYKGILTKLQMSQLIDTLKTIGLKYQPYQRRCTIDATPKTLIVFANNKQYVTKGCTGNYLLDKLLDLLWNYNSDKQTQLKKYMGKLRLEDR